MSRACGAWRGLCAAALLAAAGIAPALADEVDAIPLSYLCDMGARLDLALDPRGQQLFGQIQGRPVLMPQAPAASGARYIEMAEGERGGRYELWTKGDEAMLNWVTEGESVPLFKDCHLQK